jgi:hypothetical protein
MIKELARDLGADLSQRRGAITGIEQARWIEYKRRRLHTMNSNDGVVQ